MPEIPTRPVWLLESLPEIPSQRMYREAATEYPHPNHAKMVIYNAARHIEKLEESVPIWRKIRVEDRNLLAYFCNTVLEEPDKDTGTAPVFKELHHFESLFYIITALAQQLYTDIETRGRNGFIGPDDIITNGLPFEMPDSSMGFTADNVASCIRKIYCTLVRKRTLYQLDQAVRIENLIGFKVKHNFGVFMGKKEFSDVYTPELALKSIRKNIVAKLNYRAELTPSIAGIRDISNIHTGAIAGLVTHKHEAAIQLFSATYNVIAEQFQCRHGRDVPIDDNVISDRASEFHTRRLTDLEAAGSVLSDIHLITRPFEIFDEQGCDLTDAPHVRRNIETLVRAQEKTHHNLPVFDAAHKARDDSAWAIASLHSQATTATAHNALRLQHWVNNTAGGAATLDKTLPVSSGARRLPSQQDNEREARYYMDMQRKHTARNNGSRKFTRAQVHRARAMDFLTGSLEPRAKAMTKFSAHFPNCRCIAAGEECERCEYWCRKQPELACACRNARLGGRYSGLSLVGSLATQTEYLTPYPEPSEFQWDSSKVRGW